MTYLKLFREKKNWLKMLVIPALIGVGMGELISSELAVCRLADEQGIVGTVVAVPRYDFCFYMISLRKHDYDPLPESMYTIGSSSEADENRLSEIGEGLGEAIEAPKSWPCVQQYFHKTSAVRGIEHAILAL